MKRTQSTACERKRWKVWNKYKVAERIQELGKYDGKKRSDHACINSFVAKARFRVRSRLLLMCSEVFQKLKTGRAPLFESDGPAGKAFGRHRMEHAARWRGSRGHAEVDDYGGRFLVLEKGVLF